MVEKNYKKCYYSCSYTTGGSGINHMEYNRKESTVWANVWTSTLFFCFSENDTDITGEKHQFMV